MGLRIVAVIVILSGVVEPVDVFAQHGATAYEQATTLLRQGMIKQAEEVLLTDLRDHPEDDHDLNLLGTTLDAQERFDEAEEIYSRALKIAPNSASLLNNLGNHYATRGQFERARTAYLDVVRIEPHHANASLHLAQISIAQNHGQDALGYLDNLLEPDRSMPTAQFLRAGALHLSGQQASSLAVLDQLEKQYPKSSSVIFSVGLTFADWGRYDDAERAFTKALASNPRDIDILYNIGLAATRAGHLDHAEEAFQSVLKQRPDDVDALSGLARVYIAEGHDDRAVALLVKAHQLAPRRAEILFSLAQAEEKRGDYAESANALEAYLKLEPNDSVAEREFAFAIAHSERSRRGLEKLASYVNANPRDSVGFYELALAETVSEQDKALDDLNQAIAIDPNLLPARYARAVLNFRTGKPGDSVNDLTFLLERNPDDYRALDLLGGAHTALKQDQDAVIALRRAAQLAPRDPRILMHYSRALLRVDQPGESKSVLVRVGQLGVNYRPVKLFESAGVLPQDETPDSISSLESEVRANSADVNLNARLAEAQLAKGEVEKALASFDKELELNPNGTILAGCGKALLGNKQYAEARKFLEKALMSPNSQADVRLDYAIAVFHTSGAGAALSNLEQIPIEDRQGDWFLLDAQLLGSMGKYKEAIANLNQGLAASPNRPDLLFEAARFLLDYSHYNEAVEFLRKATRLFPSDPKLLLSQALLYALLHRQEDAEKTLAELELRWPEWGRPYLINGIIVVNHARFSEAKSLMETAIALGDSDALAYFNLALADMGDSPPDTVAAQEAISQAVRLAPEDPYIQWLAGKVSFARGNYDGALKHLEAALHYWPDMVEAHTELSATYRALGEREKSIAELKEVSRIKQSNPGPVQTPPRPKSSMADLLISVRPPE